MLRISLRRSRADWPIVLAAGLICILAASLLAAGTIYANAVSIAGLHRVLADAPVRSANIAISTRVATDAVDAVDAVVVEELARVFGPIGGEVVLSARSDSFALPDQPTGEVRALAVLGYTDGLAEHGTLLDGAWPTDPQAGISDVPVAVAETVASRLGLEIGERVPLRSQLVENLVVPVLVQAIFRIDDPTDPFWWDETLVLDGRTSSERFDTNGPFFTTRAALVGRAAEGRVQVSWHARPDADAVRVPDIEGLRDRAGQLHDRLQGLVEGNVTVETALPQILRDAERSLLVSRTGVLLLTIQLVVLAAYAVLLSAALLIEHRRVDTAMLRSRGAGPWRIVGLAAIEGIVLTVPAAIAGPWLGAAALHAFNVAGPLADIGLSISPEVSSDAYLAAGAAALVCLLALLLPALRTARSFAATHGKLARGETATIGQRLGLDIALLAIAGVGLWQLRHYGAPLTRSVQGTLGLDPLLVATPAIGLLAGGIVALRLVPLLAQLIERATVGTSGLVASLGARQLARRPLRYTRSALLLMLAMALGVFAVSYTVTWSASQRDQATHEIGSDVRFQAGGQRNAMPRWAIDRALGTMPSIVERMPVERQEVRLTGSAGGGEILAVDASVALSIVHVRADLSSEPLGDLMRPLASGRPMIEAARLPGEPSQVRMAVDLQVRALERLEFDPDLGIEVTEAADLSDIAGWPGLAASVVVRDARGTLHRFRGDDAPVDGRGHTLTVPLGVAPDTAPASFAYPLDLLAVELSVSLPEGYQTPDATLRVTDVEAAGNDDDWLPVGLELAGGWRSSAAFYGRPHQVVDDTMAGPALEAVAGQPGLRVLPGIDQFGRAAVLTFAPASIGHVADAPIPVVAAEAFLAATAARVGDVVTVLIDGVAREVALTSVLRAVPGTSPDDPVLVMDLASLSLLRFEGNDSAEAPGEWWLAVEPGGTAAVVAALSAPPIGSRAVLSQAERSRALSTDPVALGIIGALVIGFVAAALFAVVGFVVSAAVSARERITEFALLRALGLSANQLSVWLSLENAVMGAVSLAAGTALGLVIAWVVLPFITVTQGATTPFPPVEVDVPWTTIVALQASGVVALALTVGFLAWLLRRIGLASVLRMSED